MEFGVASGGQLEFKRGFFITALVATLFGMSVLAFAELGGDVTSIQVDQARMKGALRIQTAQNYTIHELHQESGTVVREFISPSGKVFAVSWQGPFIPNLRQLLGAHFDQYSQAAQTRVRHSGRTPLNLQLSGLVVQTGGHMRAFNGRAYLPDGVPEGVRLEEIH